MHLQDPVAALEKMAIVDQAGWRDRGAGVRFRLDRDRAAVPGHGRVQSPVRGRVQGPWSEPQSRAPDCRCSSRRPGLGFPTARLPRRNSCRSRTWRRCWSAFTKSLFASATELGIADPRPRRGLQGRYGGGRRGRALLLSDPHSDWRLEAPCITRTRACRSNLPLLLAGHRVATYITAEPRRMSRRIAEILGTDAYALREGLPGAASGPARSARKRGPKWRK